MTVFAVVVLLVLFVLFFLVEPRRCSQKQAETFCRVNYAHRGLHTKDCTVPENSLPAFRLAAEAGYGIELDVQLTGDGQVVVFHDPDLQRLCGAAEKVADLDYADLRRYTLGTSGEKIPLFTQVLEAVAGRVPVLVELKSGDRNRELCRKTDAILAAYDGPYCIESFDPRIVGWFQRHRANVFRGQLADSYKNLKESTSPFYAFAVSWMLGNFLGRPHFIAHGKGKKTPAVRFCHWLGAKRFAWTVTDRDDYKAYERQNDSVIFQYYTPNPWVG